MTKKRNGKWDEYSTVKVLSYGRTLIVDESGKLSSYVSEMSEDGRVKGCIDCDLECSIARVSSPSHVNFPCHKYKLRPNDNWHFRNLKYSLILASHIRTLNLNI